ncbi:TPA: DUF3800 domain-containing protein [Acinetobacter baumannii]|uniref:DUF3800 domain-containing protein n=1 Tax=Acinetobacter baumannii TaxID=470 RepID=UPI0010FD0A9D|nr:DUF3800 domain-containing protein [Acinetobacter baumannii]NPC35449.1 DUF3800 domain-containing protein [Acinetobacter baumannii]TLK93163.1 DUF3800 domain-containing protein [Acinetobacter baumannii]HBI2466974.1 DUF3800 domain-containing protein [Acinetobacter baumannii]HBI2561064.1 DUF3800 domain-containing protein [Acinetobacter baumannii]HEE6155778.1 DUF3800 domain-containing protein [Acinetobacter baumannii]
MRTFIYLDESSDLGWNMEKPYQKGGSSRMLTLAAICLPENKVKYVQRIVRALYEKRKRPLKNELKSVDLNLKDKEIFVKLTAKLIKDHPDIQLRSITANKEFVNARFKNDPNAFYNYMVKLLLLGTICKHKYVDFMPDRRSERVSLKWNMGEYLKQMVLECGIENQIVNQSCNIMPMDSSKCLELQFIDFYAGLVWSAYEFKDMTARKFMAENRNTNHKLFFPKEDKVDNIVDEAV